MLETLFPLSEFWSWETFFLYFIIALFVVALCKSGAKKQIDGSDKLYMNLQYFAAFLLLFSLGAFHAEDVGPDTVHYIRFFEQADYFTYKWYKLFDFTQMEPGFLYYLHVLRKISTSNLFFFSVTSALVSYAYIKFIKYYFVNISSFVFLQILIFFFVSNISGIRSAVGTVPLLFSFIALDKKQYLKAVVLTALASLFHYTMLFNFFSIFMCWLGNRKAFTLKRLWWIIIFVSALVVSVVSVVAITGLFEDTKYGYYVGFSLEDRTLLGNIFYLLYAILCFLNYKKLMKERKTALILSLSQLSLFPFLYITGAYRIPNYYALPRLAIWCQMSDYINDSMKIDKRNGAFLEFILQIIVFLYLLFRFRRSAFDGNFEYTFFWDQPRL